METVNSGLIGGAFGLLEMQTRMSAQPPRKIGEWWRSYETPGRGELPDGTIDVGIRNSYKWSDVFADNNWSMITSIVSFTQLQTQQDGRLLTTDATISDKITPRQLPEEDCNFLINYYFGNVNSVIATRHDPLTGGLNREDHLVGNGAIHIYGNGSGSAKNSPLYLPLDGKSKPTFLAFPLSNAHEEKDGADTWSNVFRWKYKNGLVIEVFHVGGTQEGKKTPPRTTSTLGSFPNQTNLAGSTQIGYIGGLGGDSSPDYIHSHLNFKVNGNRVDPRHFYCAGYPMTLKKS